MKIFSYIRYFFFLASNWNPRIAWHIISNEIKGEKKYGIDTTGADGLRQLEKKGIDISHATIYMPASYDLLERVYENTIPANCRHFIDLGCGKGRPMCVAAHYGVKKMTGIDFSAGICSNARLNLESTGSFFPELSYSVINNDAFYYEIPDDADFIFLFNPFDEVIMSGVLQNIKTSLEKKPRQITIAYLNPLHKELFLSSGYEETFHTKTLNYLEASVLKSPA